MFLSNPSKFSLILSAGLICLTAPVYSAQEENAHRMDTVVVTATRTAQSVNESVSSVRVISEEEITKSQARSVPDLLNGLVGVHFSNNGGRGQLSSLFMRGTSSDHIIVLVDGIKIGSATSGTVPYQHINLDQIERIEVVRGPRSSLYGSEAIGGVIQIFTKKAEQEFSPELRFTLGSHSTFEHAISGSGRNDDFFFSGSVSQAKTSGFDSCHADAGLPWPNGGGCYADQPDKDGYDNTSGNLVLGLDLGNGSEISVHGSISDSETEFDGNSQDSSKSKQEMFGLSGNFMLSDNWFLKAVIGRSEDDSDNYLNGNYQTTFSTVRDSVSVQNDLLVFGQDTLSFGLDYLRDEIDTYGDLNYDGFITAADQFNKVQRENWGGFVQYLKTMDKHDVELSVRHDDDGQFGGHFTGGLGYGFALSDQVRLVASYGTAFKAPSFNELYYPDYGIATLDPEESRTFEVGIRNQRKDGRVAITYVRTEVDDLIGYDFLTNGPNNIDKAEIKGLEVEVDQQLSAKWRAGVDLSLLSPKDAEGSNEGNLLPRRPEKSGRFDLDYLEQNWSAGVSMYFAGTRYDDQANTKKLKAYRTVDLKGETSLDENWLLQAKVENVFDSNYETARFYNQADRSIFLTLRYTP